MEVKKFATILSIFSLLLPIVVAVTKLRSLNEMQRLFFYFLVYSFSIEIISTLFLSFHEMSNMFILNTYSGVELLFYIYLLYGMRNPKSLDDKFPLIAIIIFLVWICLTMLKGYIALHRAPVDFVSNFHTGLTSFNQYFLVFKSILLIVMAARVLIYFSAVNLHMVQDWRFWTCLGILVYFAINISIFSSYFIPLVGSGKVNDLFGRYVWSIHNIVNLVSNALFAIGFYQISKRI